MLKIFETFGPVSCPLYSVRFNSAEHIAEHGVEIGAKVYYVPNVSEWTHYVFLEHVKAYVCLFVLWQSYVQKHVSDLDLYKVCGLQ